MIIFSLSNYQYLAKSLLKHTQFKAGRYDVRRFTNGTILLSLKTEVKNKNCFVLGGATPHSDLVELLLLSHTLKKEGARKIIAILPYLAYSRQDENKNKESWGAKWLGEILAASGVSQVVTIDAHSQMTQESFPIPLTSLSAAELLANALKSKVKESLTCVAPDEGAIDNCANLNSKLGIEKSIAFFKKERSARGIKIFFLQGEVGENVIVSDDILDTGETLFGACLKLKQEGIKNIEIVVSHGLFNGSIWKKIWALGVRHVYCTDSNPGVRKLVSKKIVVVPIASLIVHYLIKNYESARG